MRTVEDNLATLARSIILRAIHAVGDIKSVASDTSDIEDSCILASKFDSSEVCTLNHIGCSSTCNNTSQDNRWRVGALYLNIHLVDYATYCVARGVTTDSSTYIDILGHATIVSDDHLAACRAISHCRLTLFLKIARDSSRIYGVCQLDVCILEVNTLDEYGVGCAEQRSIQTLDRVAITAEYAGKALHRCPILACHIHIGNHHCVIIGCRSHCAPSQERCLVLDDKDGFVCCIFDSVRELADVTCDQRLLLIGLDGRIHHATLSVVECDIHITIDACRHCYVEVGWLARELNTLAKRVLDKRLRCLGCSRLALLEIERKCTCDRLAVDGRDLSLHECCATRNTKF